MKNRTSKVISRIVFSMLLAGMTFVHAKGQTLTGQKKNQKSLTVLNIDSKGVNLDPVQMGNLVRIELEKLDTFEVMDRYDVSYVIEKNKLNIGNCFGKICLVEVGSQINSEKMFTGSVELYGETIIMTFRLIDVKTATIERTQVNEYLNLPKELQAMVKLSVRQMFGRKVDETTLAYLSRRNNFESATNNPNKERVNLSGPRSGFTVFTGKTANILQESKTTGGFGASPVMFQFGYQFEAQYLNEGNYQALFEFLPVITGFDQNIFIPSLTIMNGFRDNKHGWEIAFGPTFSLVQVSNGYYDGNNGWHLSNEWQGADPANKPAMESRLDSRGALTAKASFILAVGRTIKSGKLNIPINAYVIPSLDGWRAGLSVGFNAKRH
jgi:hypothetical protein